MTQKEDAFQPLNMPDLEEIVSEAGEDGLQMTIIHHPFRLENFMKEEDVEEGDYDVKLRTDNQIGTKNTVSSHSFTVLSHSLTKKLVCSAGSLEPVCSTEQFDGVRSVWSKSCW